MKRASSPPPAPPPAKRTSDMALSSVMGALMNEPPHPDTHVTFLVGAAKLPFSVHRWLLTKRADKYEGALERFKTSKDVAAGTFELPDTDEETFAAFRRFLYTDELPADETPDDR